MPRLLKGDKYSVRCQPNNTGGLTATATLSHRVTGDYASAVLDEVALEGLDGITLEALWTRLKPLKLPLDLENDQDRDFVWNILLNRAKKLSDVYFYKLPSPRTPLIVYDRYQHVDPDMGVVIEPETLPPDPYTFEVVENEAVKGSCSDFKTREDLTQKILNEKVENLKDLQLVIPINQLAIVCSQDLRARSLLGTNYDPLLVDVISDIQWALLERIGRSRYLGEVTQGKTALSKSKIPPKTQFYYRKMLITRGLVTKQELCQKINGSNAHGLLLQLPRFYTERKSKAQTLTHSIVTYLKTKPGGLAPYPEVIETLGLQASFKKLAKHNEFKAHK